MENSSVKPCAPFGMGYRARCLSLVKECDIRVCFVETTNKTYFTQDGRSVSQWISGLVKFPPPSENQLSEGVHVLVFTCERTGRILSPSTAKVGHAEGRSGTLFKLKNKASSLSRSHVAIKCPTSSDMTGTALCKGIHPLCFL